MLYLAAEDDNKLTMADFLKSMENVKNMEGDEFEKERVDAVGLSSSSLKKDLKKIAKGSSFNYKAYKNNTLYIGVTSGSSPALQLPLSAVKQQRIQRKVNYDKNKQNTAKWLNQVKKNRESEYVDYTIEENRTNGATLASMATEYEPKDDLEQEIQKALAKDGLASEKDIIEKEQKDLLQLDPEEMMNRVKQMSKLKFILFNQELKNKRIARIKSKLYHKIKRKAKEKEEAKLIQELELIDPAAAKEYMEKLEEKRVEERISLRHGSTSKFAKSLKRFGKFDNQSTKQAYFNLLKQRDELKKKTKRMNDLKDEEDSDESSLNSINSEDENNAVDKLKEEAINKINKEISESSSESSDSENDLGFSEEKLKKRQEKEHKKKANKQSGIMGMKFMQKAENVQKELLKEKSKILMDEIKNYWNDDKNESNEEEDEDELLDNNDNAFPNNSTENKQKFRGENPKTAIPLNIELDNTDVKEITTKINKKPDQKQKLTDNEPKDHIDRIIESTGQMSANEVVEKWQGSVNKLSGSKRSKNALTFDNNADLKDFNIDSIKNRKRVKFDEIDEVVEEEQENRKIYITNEEMEQEEFDKQKQNLIEEQMDDEINNEDKKIDKPMDGWGSWAGEGISKSKTDILKEKKRRERKIDEIKKKRLDGNKSNVIINESRDKKFTK